MQETEINCVFSQFAEVDYHNNHYLEINFENYKKIHAPKGYPCVLFVFDFKHKYTAHKIKVVISWWEHLANLDLINCNSTM